MTVLTCCFPLQQEGALIPGLVLQQSIRPSHRMAHEDPRPAQGDTTLARANAALSIIPVNRAFTILLYSSGATPERAVLDAAAADAQHVVVTDREGKEVSINLSKDTKYEQAGAPAQASALKVERPCGRRRDGQAGESYRDRDPRRARGVNERSARRRAEL
jgi:hypothetical protein